MLPDRDRRTVQRGGGPRAAGTGRRAPPDHVTNERRHGRPRPRSALHWIAFGGGAGLVPGAPGTAGTVVAIPIYLIIGGQPPAAYAVVVALVVGAGIWACGRTARDLGVHDHPGIVLDEIAGYLVTMTALPFEWPWIVAGFVAFRVFDVAKPWPVSLADRKVGGGLGIMLDDVIAGVLACAMLHAVRYAIGG